MSRVASSAQWTSSSRSSIGDPDSASRTFLNSRSLLTPASSSTAAISSGKASRIGPSASAVVTLSQEPRRTATLATLARAAASVVLPTPASPPRNTSRPLPSSVSPSNPSSDARKPARSISTPAIKSRHPPEQPIPARSRSEGLAHAVQAADDAGGQRADAGHGHRDDVAVRQAERRGRHQAGPGGQHDAVGVDVGAHQVADEVVEPAA